MTWTICPELTNHCNYTCPKCPHVYWNKPTPGGNIYDRSHGYMSRKVFDLIIENAIKYARLFNIGFFGEQLLHPKFNDFIKSVPTDRTFSFTLNTNWAMVTDRHIETLKLFDNIRISLDTHVPERYDIQQPGSVLDLSGNTTQDRYNTIIEKLEYWFSLPDHPMTRIVHTISSVNEHYVQEFLHHILPILPRRDYVLTKTILSYGGVMQDSYMKPNPCRIPDYKWFIIAWNGDCSPCNLDVNIALKVGNILEDQDIEVISQGAEWNQVMNDIINNKGICANCFDANNWTESKRYHGKA